MSSAGPDAIEFAATCGLILDEWEAWVLDLMFSEDENARLLATVIVLILPRQNGKNVILEAFELYCFYVLRLKMILHTAHLGKTAAGHMRRMKSLIRRNRELRAITKIYESNGKEAFIWTDDDDVEHRLEFITRSKESSRGGSPDLIVFDEALFLSDEQLQAILPAISAQSMNEEPPQIVYTSSAPLASSVVLQRVRDAAIVGLDERTVLAEWSMDPADYDRMIEAIRTRDDAALAAAMYLTNPGLGIRISLQHLFTVEVTQMSPEALLIERLGYVPPSDAGSRVLAGWSYCLDTAWMERTPVRVALSVAVGGTSACLAIAGTRSDGTHVEVTEHLDGTAWIVESAKAATKALGKLVVDPMSPTAGVIDDLKAAKVPLQEISTRDWMTACAGLQNAVKNRKVHHIGQHPLDAAVIGADIRPIGDGGWAWARKSSSVDICPLEAVTLAHWANAQKRPRSRYIDLNAVLAAAEAKENA